MTIKRLMKCAERRGMYFDGKKKWRNNLVGVAYEIFTPDGRGFFQADTVEGLRKFIMRYPIEHK